MQMLQAQQTYSRYLDLDAAEGDEEEEIEFELDNEIWCDLSHLRQIG